MEKRERMQRLCWWLVIIGALLGRVWWLCVICCAVGIGVNIWLLKTRQKEQPSTPCYVAIALFAILILLNLISILAHKAPLTV